MVGFNATLDSKDRIGVYDGGQCLQGWGRVVGGE